MSLVKRDFLLEWLWDQPTVVVLIITAMVGTWAIWVIEYFRSQFDHDRPPYGLTIFRWRSNFIGDLFFLTGAVTIMDIIYSKVVVSSSFFTGSWFFLMAACFGLASASTFLMVENKDPKGYGNLGVKRFNWNRVYHFGYVTLMVYIFLGYLRLLFYGEQLLLVALTAVCYLGWAFVTIYLDSKGANRIWEKVTSSTGRSKYL